MKNIFIVESLDYHYNNYILSDTYKKLLIVDKKEDDEDEKN